MKEISLVEVADKYKTRNNRSVNEKWHRHTKKMITAFITSLLILIRVFIIIFTHMFIITINA
jgi:hypothetical protein